MTNTINVDMFTKHISVFLAHLKKIVHNKEKRKLNLNGQPNVVLDCLNKYAKAYEYSCKSDINGSLNHVDDFVNFFKRYRKDLLKIGTERTETRNIQWLKRGNVYIQFGDGVEGVSLDIKIYLSEIYLMACEIKKTAEKKLEGLPDKEWETCKELNYPDVLLLHLFRILRDINLGTSDSDYISAKLKDIERVLGCSENTTTNTTSSTDSSMFDTIGKMMQPLLSGLMKSQGETGQGTNMGEMDFSKLLDPKSLTNILSSLMNNSGAQNVFGSETQNEVKNMVEQLTKNKEVSNILTSIASSLQETDLGGTQTLQTPQQSLPALSASSASSAALLSLVLPQNSSSIQPILNTVSQTVLGAIKGIPTQQVNLPNLPNLIDLEIEPEQPAYV